MDTITALPGLDELKAKHRAMWGLGDYPHVADTVIPDLGATLVDAAAVGPGDAVLDVAAGAGNVSLPAARRGARVTATDLNDTLLAECAARAAAAGLAVDCRPADAEALPFDDGSFDVVLSCVGVMFAPHHDVAAGELVRVCRPGGRVAVLSWTPEGFVGDLFRAMRAFVPPPPPGVQPAPLWGASGHLAGLVGDRLTDVTETRGTVRVDSLPGPTDFRDLFRSSYGPTVAAYRGLGDDAAAVARLDATLDDLAAGARLADGSMEWEYLIVSGSRAR